MTACFGELHMLSPANGALVADSGSLTGRRAAVPPSTTAELIVEPVHAHPGTPGDPDEWPFAGRGAELDRIKAALARGRSVVLFGKPGVGKSTLLRAALEQAAAGNSAVAKVVAARPDAAAESLDAWLGKHRTSSTDRAGDSARTQESADDRSMVLGIDNVHLLNSASAERLHHLAAHYRLTLITTMRPSASLPEVINQLWVDRLAERIDVEPFDGSGVTDVLRAKLGGQVDARTVARLHQVTVGDAQFLRELVDQALTEGSLRTAGGVWQWSGLVGTAGRLVDVVRLRLGDLAPPEAELINMLALAGSLKVDLPVVASLGQVAEALNQRGIAVIERIGRTLHLRLAYPLYNEVVVATMPELTARRLRIRLAEALEQVGIHNQHDKLLAQVLRIEAGQAIELDRLLVAAKTASKRADFALVERFTRPVLHHCGDDVAAVEVALLLGHALAEQGRFAEVESSLAAVSTTVPAARAELARVRARNMATRLHRADVALAILDEVIGVPPAADAGLLYATRAYVGILADQLADVVATSTALLAGQAPESALSQALVPAVAFASDAMGDSRTTLALLTWCRPALAGWANESWCAHQVATAQAAFLMGHRGDLATALSRLHQHPIDDMEPSVRLRVTLLRAQLNRSTGQFADAIDKFRTAYEFSDARTWFTSRSWILAQLAGTLAEAEQLDEAMRTLDEARSLHDTVVPCSIDGDGVALETAVVLAHSGERAKAVTMARELAERCSSAGRLTQAIAALHLAARLGDAGAVADRCTALASNVSALIPRAYADHVRALARNNGDALAHTADRFAVLGLFPLAAEAAAQACAAHRALGRRKKMRTMATKCHELLAQFAGTLPVWVCADPLPPAEHALLTEREREVSTLAAKGLSNRDIASRLVISVRTVENHLQRTYGKLGIASRAHLALSLRGPAQRSAGWNG